LNLNFQPQSNNRGSDLISLRFFMPEADSFG